MSAIHLRCALWLLAGFLTGSTGVLISNGVCAAADPPAQTKEGQAKPAEAKHTPEQQAKLDEAEKLSKQMMELHGQGKYAEAAKLAQQALEIDEAVLGPDHPEVASALSNLGSMYQAQGKLSQAAPVLERALQIQEKASGPDDPDNVIILNNLAMLYKAQSKFSQAEPLYLRALAIREKVLKPDDPKIANTLNNLAAMYDEQGKYAQAEPMYQRALSIREKALGPDHPVVAESLGNLAVLYCNQGKFVQAEPLYQRALKIEEKSLSPDHPSVANTLSSMAQLDVSEGKYSAAEPLFQRALKITEKSLGPDHPQVASVLNGLADAYGHSGKYSEVEPLLQRALKIEEKSFGPNHPEVANTMGRLGELYRILGKYDQAEPQYQRALAIYEKMLGPDHPYVAGELNIIGALYVDEGKYAQAEPLFQRALKIQQKTLGAENPDVAESLHDLANLYFAQGKDEQAEQLEQQGLKIREKALGPDHPDVASSLINLGGLYRNAGRYPEAEPLLRRALAIRQKALGPDHPMVAESLSSLADFCRAQGQYSRAEPLYQQALKIREKAFGPDHFEVAVSLNNLAENYRVQWQMTQAEPLYRRALKIQENALGPDHPDVASSLNNLALLYCYQDQYAQAEPLYQRALKINEKTYGLEHPDDPRIALSLANLAGMYRTEGQYSQAEPLERRALEMRKKSLGLDDPKVALSFSSLSELQAAMGHWAEAAHNQDQSRRVIRRHVARALPSLSPAEQTAFLQANDASAFQGSLSLGLERRSDPEIVAVSTNWLLNGKGVAQEALAQNAQLARDSSDPSTAETAKQLLQARQQLAALVYAAPKSGGQQERKLQLDHLQQQETELARKIAQAHGEAFQADPWIDVAQVRKAIPPKAVLVDIARFQPFSFQTKGIKDKFQSARYVAWLVPAAGEGEIRIVDLGEAEPIDKLVVLARQEIQHRRSVLVHPKNEQTADPSTKIAATLSVKRGLEQEDEGPTGSDGSLQSLAKLILEPLKPHLEIAEQLIISPDTSLWLVPWAALPLDDNRYAIEKYQISYAISGRDLIANATGKLKMQPPALFANPDYDLQPADVATATRSALVQMAVANQPLALNREVSRSANGAFQVKRLPGTADEAKAIEPKIKEYCHAEPIAFLDRNALEGAFKALRQPQVLVLSTHGFFLPDQTANLDNSYAEGVSTAAASTSRTAALSTEGVPLENPLLRCGLLLAGCNRSGQAVNNTPTDAASKSTAKDESPVSSGSSSVDDGILTGMEIVGTDLRGTELVVLSACETGIGQVRNGEGVAGLRQAFQLAGAQAVVATLWQIPDQETSRLMSDFFTNLAHGQTKADALRAAQLAAIKSSRAATGNAPPFYWAAFTLTGR
ncbi:MAG TPA: tetratricopeptide repeat protein [Pirellulales bacterium]|jgi:tetratricopeptide (TPR) repeat protein